MANRNVFAFFSRETKTVRFFADFSCSEKHCAPDGLKIRKRNFKRVFLTSWHTYCLIYKERRSERLSDKPICLLKIYCNFI